MALTNNCIKFLFYSKQKGVSFEETLMLGRLTLLASKESIKESIAFFKNNQIAFEAVTFRDEYSEPVFEILGSHKTDSMDFSNYEGATIIHDLNEPIDSTLKGKYTAIVDGGTIEHVFNFPQAIKNCMEMLKIGGHYIGVTPVNNTMGHGFYQYSPELYFNIFSEENGFRVKQVIICTQHSDGTTGNWYEVLDPKIVKGRVMLVNNNPTFLMVLAEKVTDTKIFAATPQQSDYVTLWSIKQSLKENIKPLGEGKIKFLYRKFTPKFLKIFLHNLYDLFTKERIVIEDLGKIDGAQFKKIEL